MEKRIGFYREVSAWILLLGLSLFLFGSCNSFSMIQNGGTSDTEGIASPADTVNSVSGNSSAEEITRIPVSTKEHSTTEPQPDSSNTTESTPAPTPPSPSANDTAVDAGIGEVLSWDREKGLQ